ncbi:endonuclease VIII, partial [Candidatus Endoriftia persephone str. Guaymas]|nr:endonuclease VIII [Candidatus Endoriftia persephone str. Guaymas]
MPEGPEIRRAADAVESILKGRIASEVWFSLPRLQPFAADNGLTLYSHNQLYGRWHCVRRGERPETRRQLRLRISTES